MGFLNTVVSAIGAAAKTFAGIFTKASVVGKIVLGAGIVIVPAVLAIKEIVHRIKDHKDAKTPTNAVEYALCDSEAKAAADDTLAANYEKTITETQQKLFDKPVEEPVKAVTKKQLKKETPKRARAEYKKLLETLDTIRRDYSRYGYGEAPAPVDSIPRLADLSKTPAYKRFVNTNNSGSLC